MKDNFAIVIPDLGDRPAFIGNCMRQLGGQCDREHIYVYGGTQHLSKKYERAYKELSAKYDIIFFIENDDWYSPDYIERMLTLYYNADQPDIFGIGYTIYYHLAVNKYFVFEHPDRASMMATMIKTKLNISFPAAPVRFLDMYLWQAIKKSSTVNSLQPPITVGMKHNIGKTAGSGHHDLMKRYKEDDRYFKFLKDTLDKKSYEFYNNIASPLARKAAEGVRYTQ